MKRDTNKNRGMTDRAVFLINQLVPSEEKMKEAAKAGAEVLVQEARRRAPVRTGTLRDSVDMRYFKSSKTDASYLVFSSAWYADAVEKTPGRNKRPFMRPAFDAKQNEISRVMEGELTQRDRFDYRPWKDFWKYKK